MGGLDPRLLRRGRTARSLLVVDSALAVVMALLVLAQAVLLARVAAGSFDGASLEQVSTPLVVLATVIVARALAGWGFEVVGRRAAASVISELRRDVVDARLRRQPSALDGVQSAEVATAAVSGVDALDTTFARYLPQTVLAVVVPVAVLALVASIDLLAAGVMLLTLPLVPIFMWLVGRHTEQRALEQYQARAVLANHFLDVVRGLPTLRAFNRARAQSRSIVEVSDAYRRSTMRTLRIAFLSGSILELAATLGIALVAVVVGIRLARGGIAFQPALTVLVLAPELYLPLRNLAAQFHASADGAAVAARMLDLTEAPHVTGTADPPDPGRQPIAFEAVAYRYPTRDAEVLEDVSFEVRPGETIAIVGPSGGGKSTVISLLMRFADPSAGRILVGGVDLAGCDPRAWRRQTALVPQHPTLFRGTIADNIRLGDRAADDGAVRWAAELAGADDFVACLPHGYGTVVGDGGRQLSAGQRRRVALARAFLRDAPLVLLDEPTADLDGASADIVADAIERLRVGRTVLLVAHRPELAVCADRIVQLEGGRVLERPMVAA